MIINENVSGNRTFKSVHFKLAHVLILPACEMNTQLPTIHLAHITITVYLL